MLPIHLKRSRILKYLFGPRRVKRRSHARSIKVQKKNLVKFALQLRRPGCTTSKSEEWCSTKRVALDGVSTISDPFQPAATVVNTVRN